MLELADRRSLFELDIIQLNLISLFESAHEFNAIERTELQITFKAGGFGVQLNGTACDSRDESGE